MVARVETFNPDPDLAAEAKRRGLQFTVGKKYAILAEFFDIKRVGTRYVAIDDLGHRRSINSIHFNEEPRLVWDDLVDWDKLFAKKHARKTTPMITKSGDTITLRMV